ncbi:MAG: hypothetical protein V3U76_03710 [Granulosicoccus sp.]
MSWKLVRELRYLLLELPGSRFWALWLMLLVVLGLLMSWSEG